MHIRKKFLIYKMGYRPFVDNYVTRRSKRQAWNVARRMGPGAEVHENIYRYDKKRTRFWVSSSTGRIWDWSKE